MNACNMYSQLSDKKSIKFKKKTLGTVTLKHRRDQSEDVCGRKEEASDDDEQRTKWWTTKLPIFTF